MKKIGRGVVVGLGSLGIALAIAVLFFDVKALVVTSGSMAPELPIGSFIIAVPVDGVQVGDIVSVERGSSMITHRVVAVSEQGLTLKGDANAAVDQVLYSPEQIYRLAIDIPFVGYVVSYLPSLLLFILLLGLGWKILPRKEVDQVAVVRQQQTSSIGGKHLLGALFALALAFGATTFAVNATQAFFTDTGTMTSGSFESHSVLAVSLTCTDVPGTPEYVEVRWDHTDLRYEYDWEIVRVSDSGVVKSGTLTPTGSVPQEVGLDLVGADFPSEFTDWKLQVTTRILDGTWESTASVTNLHTADQSGQSAVRCGFTP